MPRLALLLPLLLLAACGDRAPDRPDLPEATTSAEVADRMLERFERGVAGVDSFTVVGAGLQMHYRVLPDTGGVLDRLQARPERVDSVELDLEAAQLLQMQIPNVPRIAQGFREAAFGGAQTLGGRRGYVLSSEDPGALIGELGTQSAPQPGVRETLRILVDADTYDILEIFRTATADSLDRPVSQRLVFEDFRTEGGLTLPFTVRQVGEGLDQYISEDEKIRLGGRLELQRRQLEAQADSPERNAQLAEVAGQQSLLAGQPQTSELTVDRVIVAGR